MRTPRLCAALAVALAATVAACTMSEVNGLMAVSSAISAKYKQPAKVSLANELRLEITFQNSPYATAPEAEAEKFAREVALTAYAAYAERDSLQAVSVGFGAKPGTSVDSLSHMGVPYVFSTPKLKAAADSIAHQAKTP
jgi:hypothetical protein